MILRPTRKYTNLAKVRNALNRRQDIRPIAKPTTEELRRQALEIASAPLTGPIGDLKVQQDRRAREAEARGDKEIQDRGFLPRFDDLF